MTADELLKLHETINRLRDETETSPEANESTALGYLQAMDWNTLHHAAGVVHRLYLWRKFPTVNDEHNYLRDPAFTFNAPQSLRVQP